MEGRQQGMLAGKHGELQRQEQWLMLLPLYGLCIIEFSFFSALNQ